GDGYDGRERVDAIDEIDRVDHADDPDHRDDRSDDTELDVVSAKRNGGEMNAEADQDHRRRKLDKELLRRIGTEQVVVDPQADDERAAGQNGKQVSEVLGNELRGVG